MAVVFRGGLLTSRGGPSPRILAIHRYYWPDTPPYASILRSIVGRWVSVGHQVDVLSTQPSYKPEAGIEPQPKTQLVDGATVHRIDLPSDRTSRLQKVANTVLFPLAVLVRILRGRRHDVVMCSTAPPVLLGAAVAVAAGLRRSRFVYHCMDLHPEIGALSGDFTSPIVYKVLRRIDEWTCRQAAAIVVLSDDMKNVLVSRDREIESRVHVINNFELPDYEPGEAENGRQDVGPPSVEGRVRLVFTGNLGRFQGLQGLVRAAMADDDRLDDLDLVLMGDGVAKQELQQVAAEPDAHKHRRVTFLPHGTPSEARALMRTADFGLVSLTPEVIKYAYPSKTATYLSEGLPVLAVVETDSELARMVIDERIGLVAPPEDVVALTRALVDLVDLRDEVSAMHARARLVGRERFGEDTVLDLWEGLLEQLDDRTEARQ